MTAKENWKRLSKILDEADAYDRALGKLNFDLECTAPEVREDVLYILEMLRQDRERCWTMRPDGTYSREEIVPGTASQDRLYTYFGTRVVEPLPEEQPRDRHETGETLPGPIQRILSFFRKNRKGN